MKDLRKEFSKAYYEATGIKLTLKEAEELSRSGSTPNLSVVQRFYNKLCIDKIIVNADAVIVYLKNGSKGVAYRDKNDVFDFSIGFSVAYTLALANVGSKKRFKNILARIYKKITKKGK